MSSLIHPSAVIYPGARLSDDVEVGPHTVVGPGVSIGRGTRLANHVTIYGLTAIGEGCRVFPGAVLGTQPQDLKYEGEETRLEIGDHSVFREYVTINTGTGGGGALTRIGSRCFFMAYSHVGHDSRIGDQVILANNVMIAGHVHVADHVTISGGSGLHHFARVGCHAFIGGMSRCSQDVPPYMLTEGHPASVVMVNVVGLQRAGFSEGDIKALRQAHRRLYRSDNLKSEVVDEMLREDDHPGCVRDLLIFLREQGQGRHGRYLERFRDHSETAPEGHPANHANTSPS